MRGSSARTPRSRCPRRYDALEQRARGLCLRMPERTVELGAVRASKMILFRSAGTPGLQALGSAYKSFRLMQEEEPGPPPDGSSPSVEHAHDDEPRSTASASS